MFVLFTAALIVSTLAITKTINNYFSIEVPTRGGQLIEGMVGAPRFVNPILAVSPSDEALVTLLYASLIKPGPNGSYVPELAESYTISDDGLLYRFKLKDGVTWHDGKAITAEDVVWTITRTQDTNLKSARQPLFEGVNVTAPDPQTVVFKLDKPYSPFIENITMPIMPKHIWENLDPEWFDRSIFNNGAVGSGPFKVNDIKIDSKGIPEYYDLVPFEDFANGAPFLERIRVVFYPNMEEMIKAYEGSAIDSMAGVSPTGLKDYLRNDSKIAVAPMPRVFLTYLNSKRQPVFSSENVRMALSLAVDRKDILDKVLGGYGVPALSLIPPGSLAYKQPDDTEAKRNLEKAVKLLERDGWEINPKTGVREQRKDGKTSVLAFTLATGNTPDIKATAEILVRNWRTIGADVTLQVYELGNLKQDIMRPRKFEALLFGAVTGRDPDPFPLWHSSQTEDPGLNLAGYSNPIADDLMVKARTESDATKKEADYAKIAEVVKEDGGAIFIYSPSFIYVVPKALHLPDLGSITSGADRMNTTLDWSLETERIWKVFANSMFVRTQIYK